MPKGYNNPPDWRGFTGAVADAMFEQERERVRRDHPSELDALRAENEQLKEANAMLGEERDAWRQAFHRAHQVRGESLMACPHCQR